MPRRSAGSRRTGSRRTRALQEHHPLAQRRIVGIGDHGVGAAVRKVRRQHQRIRDQPANRIAGGGELRGLRDGVAEHEPSGGWRPTSHASQNRFRGSPVRRDLGIGDREAGHAAGFGEPGQPLEPLIDRERRSLGCKHHQPADRIDAPGVARQRRRGQLIRKLLVCGQEQFEWRAILNLSRQRPRGAEHQLNARAPGARERVGDLVQREIQVRGGGNDRATSVPGPVS